MEDETRPEKKSIRRICATINEHGNRVVEVGDAEKLVVGSRSQFNVAETFRIAI
jgi:hypothetical protein